MAKKNFYAVKNGNETGVFTSWDECKKAVSGYSGAEYKGFATKEEAEEYLGNKMPPSTKKEKNMKTTDTATDMKSVPIGEAIAYVDGCYNIPVSPRPFNGANAIACKNKEIFIHFYR